MSDEAQPAAPADPDFDPNPDMSDDDKLAALEAANEALHKIMAADRQVVEAREAVKEAKAELKDAEAVLATAEKTKQEAIDAAVAGQGLLPFGDRDTREQVDPDDATSVELADMKPTSGRMLPANITQPLAKAGIRTVADLVAYQARGEVVTSVDGIGPAKADLLETVMTDFWQDHPQAEGAQDAA